MSPRRLFLLCVLLLTTPVPVRALTIANFQANFVDNVCAVSDYEPITAGDPDLRFRMAVFDQYSGSIFSACGAGCTDDGVPSTLDGETLDQCGFVTTCGAWNFADRLIQKVIPNSSGAYFYFGLFDDDTDADDLMGDHILYSSAPRATTEWNNNASSGYYPGHGLTTVCAEAVEEPGSDANYRLNYSIWFSDTDGPAALAAPVARDNGVPVTVDNDLRLDFTWTLTSDPNTGISEYRASLWDNNTSMYIFLNSSAPAGGALSVCAAGCTRTYTPVPGHSYQFSVSATNGGFPQIDNPTTVFSPWTTVTVSNLLDVAEAPATLSLSAPAPNPTSAGASIAYSLPSAGAARIEVIDLQGRRVAVLADGAASAGNHRIEWDGRSDGRRVDSGVYWVRLAFGDARKLQRLVVIR